MLSIAYAAEKSAQGSNFLVNILPIVIIMVLFYFIIIRPEYKRRQEHQKVLDNLKKGDKVVTAGGIFGTIAGIEDDTVILAVTDNVKIKILKTTVQQVRE